MKKTESANLRTRPRLLPQPHKLHFERAALKKGFVKIAAIDEAGRGALAGPVVAAAIWLKEFRFKARIDDSKQLSIRQRNIAAKEIFKKARVGIGIVGQKDVDCLNIANATMLAMQRAFQNLHVDADFTIIDGLKSPDIQCKTLAIKQADSRSLSCACASIIAKVTRDSIMNQIDKLLPQYGFRRHKGYGTRLHFSTIKKFGVSLVHRKTFSPVSNYLDDNK